MEGSEESTSSNDDEGAQPPKMYIETATCTSGGKRKKSATTQTAFDVYPASDNVNSPIHKPRAKKQATSRKETSATSHRTKKTASRRKTAGKKTGRSHATNAKGRRSVEPSKRDVKAADSFHPVSPYVPAYVME